MLNMMLSIDRLCFELAAYVVRHLAVFLTLLRVIVVMMILVPLVIDAGEYQNVKNKETATDGYCHA